MLLLSVGLCLLYLLSRTAALSQRGSIGEVSKVTNLPLSERQRLSKKARSELLHLLKAKAVVADLGG